MIDGTLVELRTDKHIDLRHCLLDGGGVLPEPPSRVRTVTADGPVDSLAEELAAALTESGLAIAQLDRPLTDEQFLRLGRRLGTPMPETDPSVRKFVSDEVILNLRSEHGHTSDAALQPFARNSLTLHSESSARPAAHQPRYIVLMCCDPGDDGSAAQTVLLPMSGVAERMNWESLALLSQTRYRDHEAAPFVVRRIDDRTVFSFRDFSPRPMGWTFLGDDTNPEAINEAFRDLLTSMYDTDAYGMHWRPGALVIIDNTFFFHGRTAGADSAAGRSRHLKRLRIV
jgi:hypothetical protein